MGREAAVEPDGQQGLALGHEIGEIPPLARRHRHGLLDEDGFPGLDRLPCDRVVLVVARGDEDGVDQRVVHDLAPVRGSLAEAVAFHGSTNRQAIGSADGAQGDRGHFLEDRKQDTAKVLAETDRPDPDGACGR